MYKPSCGPCCDGHTPAATSQISEDESVGEETVMDTSCSTDAL